MNCAATSYPPYHCLGKQHGILQMRNKEYVKRKKQQWKTSRLDTCNFSVQDFMETETIPLNEHVCMYAMEQEF